MDQGRNENSYRHRGEDRDNVGVRDIIRVAHAIEQRVCDNLRDHARIQSQQPEELNVEVIIDNNIR